MNEWITSPYVWIALRRRTPFLPSTSVGSCADFAPRFVVSSHADSTSSTAKAMSLTPSPCFATCSAISPSGEIGAVNTKRMSFWTQHEAGPDRARRSRGPRRPPGRSPTAPGNSARPASRCRPRTRRGRCPSAAKVLAPPPRHPFDDPPSWFARRGRRIAHGREVTAGPMPSRIHGPEASIMRSIASSPAPRAAR